MKQSITIETLCAYCDSVCENDLVSIKGKNFCCYGCATLSDVVTHIRNVPADAALKYRQLDFQESFDQLVDYQNDTLYKIAMSLPSIHCSSCIELLEDLPSFMNGVLSCQVNFEQRRCTIILRKSVPLSAVAQLLDDIGYPPLISVSQKLQEAEKETNRTNLLKLAVAGFCFGNIMLFSMPHYFGLQVASDVFFTRLFSALSIVLSIPTLVYSARDYLTSAYKALSAGKSHLNIPIAIGILSLFGWSLYELISGTGIGYLDSLAGLIFFLLIGKWFQHKVYDHVSYHRSVEDFIPLVVRKMQNGEETWTRIDSLQKGDLVCVKNEEIIPVNGTILKGIGLIDYAFITGESVPQRAGINDVVYAGGCQKAGEITVQLIEKPSIDKLWSAWSNEAGTKVFSTRWTDSISKYFTIAVIAIALLAAITWSFIDLSKALFVFSAVLIVACPCALALSAPFTYGNILRVFSFNNFFLKNAEAISVFGDIEHLVLDKTGTITEKDNWNVRFEGGVLTHSQKQMIKSVTSASTHPLSKLITQYLHTECFPIAEYKEEIGSGIQAVVNNCNIKIGSSSWLQETNKAKGTTVYVSIDGKVLGHFQIKTAYKAELQDVLEKLAKMVNISILSGDNDGEKETLKRMFPSFKLLKFNLKPKQKAQVIGELQMKEKVLMVGDGLNDSSAIQAGDLGIAITENLNGFYPGSDAVLLSDSFVKLPAFLQLAQYSKKILKWGLLFSLCYNIIGVAVAVAGLLTPIIAAILMPLSSISVVLLNTLLVRIKSKKLNLI